MLRRFSKKIRSAGRGRKILVSRTLLPFLHTMEYSEMVCLEKMGRKPWFVRRARFCLLHGDVRAASGNTPWLRAGAKGTL